MEEQAFGISFLADSRKVPEFKPQLCSQVQLPANVYPGMQQLKTPAAESLPPAGQTLTEDYGSRH